MKAITNLCTVLAASTLVLIAPAPASAGGTSFAGAGLSVAAGDVLVWERQSADGATHGIVKASTAAPALVATLLAGSNSPPYAFFSDAEVSPDGSKLVYVRNNSGRITLEVRNLATGSTTVIATALPTAEPTEWTFDEPTWSSDGNTIAYVDIATSFGNSYPTVKVVASSGGAGRTVQPSALAPAWRPDGKLIVAGFEVSQNGPPAGTGLWITGATPNDAVLIPGSEGASEQAWSPDGSHVVFSKIRGILPRWGPASIETLPAAGGTPTVIVPANGDCNSSPVWSSSAQRVYFTYKTGDCQYHLVSQIRQVASTGGTVTIVAADGYNTALSITNKLPAPVPSESHDFTGDGYADVIGRMSNGDLRAYYGNGLGLSGYRRIGTGWSGMTAIFTPGDFNGDGHNDVIGRLANGDLRLYTGVGGGPGGSTLIGTGFGGMTALFSPGDFTGDGHPDVIARNGGELRLYVGTGVRLTGGTVIGPSGWNTISAVFSPGDFNGDNHPDVIGRLPGGELVLYHGNGTRLSGSSLIGTGWNGLSALNSPGDFNLDGKPDVIGRISNGDLRLYYGTGTRLSGYRVIGTGWTSVNPIL